MKNQWNKVASVLALVIGAMAVFAGGKVLLGQDPGYYVINWLPVYNYTAGFLTIFITAVLIWRKSMLAMPLVITTFGVHALVMIILQTGYRGVVASESIKAMTVRLVVWAVILGLMVLQTPKKAAAS